MYEQQVGLHSTSTCANVTKVWVKSESKKKKMAKSFSTNLIHTKLS